MKTLLAAAAVTALLVVPALSAQSVLTQTAMPFADCGPVYGTIAVAKDARVTPDMARVSEVDARATALRAVPGATVTDIDLEEEDGFLVYEADLTEGTVEIELTIDAGNGAVLCTERDD